MKLDFSKTANTGSVVADIISEDDFNEAVSEMKAVWEPEQTHVKWRGPGTYVFEYVMIDSDYDPGQPVFGDDVTTFALFSAIAKRIYKPEKPAPMRDPAVCPECGGRLEESQYGVHCDTCSFEVQA